MRFEFGPFYYFYFILKDLDCDYIKRTMFMFVSPSPCSIPSTLEMLRERIRGLLHMRTSHRVAKEVLKRGGYIRLSADFLAEVLQVRKEKDNICTMLKEKKLPTKKALSSRVVFRK